MTPPRTGDLGPLQDGSRAVIIGGGPGGAAAAIALINEAAALGRQIEVVIVEGKQFGDDLHHNQCAGVLSPPIVELLEDQLKLPFPYHLQRSLISGYTLHANGSTIQLDGGTDTSIALRRVQFDAFMLASASQRGARVVPARVTGLEMHADSIVIYTENAPLKADVVVGAFGMDEGTAAFFTELTRYKPPPALSSIVTKYHPGENAMQKFGGRIHAFLPKDARVEFGAITPKGNHLTINIAGIGVTSPLMDNFLHSTDVQTALTGFENAGRYDPLDLRYFKGRFPRGLARHYTGDRYIMVGDAAGLVRAFKGKGINSAIQTGVRAARVIMRDGISASAFGQYHTANRDITGDLPYGQAMRLLTISAARINLMRAVLKAANHDERLRRALYDAVSAHRAYNQVVMDILSPGSVKALIRAFLSYFSFDHD